MTTRRVALAGPAALPAAAIGWAIWRRAAPPPSGEALVRALLEAAPSAGTGAAAGARVRAGMGGDERR